LLDRAGAGGLGGDEPQEAGTAVGAETDPLVSNGLGSPLCGGSPGGAALSPSSRRNCETSGFVGAAAPTGNFGIDVHIDTGLLGLSSAQLLAIVQNLFVTPLWMALVWAVHAVVVMLEWCFTIDLLEGDTLRGPIARSLHEMQSAITMPWLTTALAIAAVLCAYQGLVRRRVAQSLAEALMALAMIAGGLWVTIDPAGTVGALGDWANRASLGTLAVSARGSPGDSGGTLASGMGRVFATAIEVPWCYLEFGDVDWCRNPARLDPRLRAAALATAGSELQEGDCRAVSAPDGCKGPSSPDTVALQRSARLLRTARTNGAIFLALRPNGPERNAINDPASLLRAICRSETATDCHGPAAAAAEFRTNRGTWSRVGGLLLIAAGVVGMLLLLSFLALRLLGAAIFSLVYLMLAPVATLAPALGEAGRAVFRKWVAQLLGAVVSKLVFAFLLGVVLAILAVLEHLEALGWWTRWLLMSAFWWGLFVHRHQVLALAGPDAAERRASRRPVLHRVNETLDARARIQRRAQTARERRPPPELQRRSAAGQPGLSSLPATRHEPADVADTQLRADGRGRPSASRPAGSGVPDRVHAARSEAELREGGPGAGVEGGRRERIGRQHAQALAAGSSRRAARLAARARRIEHEAAGVHATAAPPLSAGRERRSGNEDRHRRFLDSQARLDPSDGRRGGGASGPRNYAALGGIAGYGPREYAQLDPSRKRAAREQIDRELALRRQRSQSPPERRPAGAGRSESDVMRDARDVAAGRKRKLGPERP
jgi:hypothetical protein